MHSQTLEAARRTSPHNVANTIHSRTSCFDWGPGNLESTIKTTLGGAEARTFAYVASISSFLISSPRLVVASATRYSRRFLIVVGRELVPNPMESRIMIEGLVELAQA